MADDVAAPAPEAEMTDAPAANGAGAEIPGGEGNSAPNVAAGNGGATLAEGQPAAPNAAPAKPRVFKVGDKVSALASFEYQGVNGLGAQAVASQPWRRGRRLSSLGHST